MRRASLICTFFAALSARAGPPPDASEQAKLLAEIRNYALNYTAGLPDFMCTQVIERTYFPNAALRERPLHDAIEEQVAFVGHKESYTVTKVNGKAVANLGHERLGGILSSGEFGTLVEHTLDPSSGAEFHWERSASLKGRRMNVFAFHVPATKGYGLVESKRTILVAYRGLLYSDAETSAVWRIEMQCEIPRESEYKQLDLTLDLKPAEVGGHEFVLPSHYRLHSLKVSPAQATSTLANAYIVSETTNEADYKAYRRFTADSSIRFGDDAKQK